MKAQLIAYLKALPLKTKLAVGGVVFVVTVVSGSIIAYGAHQRAIGALDAEIAAQEQTNADLRRAQDSLAKAYRTDTVRLTKIRRVTDSLTVTVDQWKHDTVKVVEYVAKADTAIRACTQALGTCEDRVRIAQLGWANARDEISRIKAIPKPNWISRHTAASVGIGATYGQDGRVAVGPTVSFGFRFFP